MTNWIQRFRSMVVSSHKQHIIIADADDLFSYHELIQAFQNDGFQIFICSTALQLRLDFELHVRDSETPCLLIAPPDYTPLPDIASQVNFHAVGLRQLFPHLDSDAIKGLGFNALCLLSEIKPYEELGHTKTLKFLLENIYNIDFESLSSPSAKERVLKALITVLLEKDQPNQALTKYLASLIRPHFPDLPVKQTTLPDLLLWLQQKWVDRVLNESQSIDFTEPSLNRTFIHLFHLGRLKAVKVNQKEFDAFPPQLKPGIFVDIKDAINNELKGLLHYLEEQLNLIEDIPLQWFQVIQILSNAKLKSIATSNDALKQSYLNIEQKLNARFQLFISNTYNSLFTLSGVRHPVVVSRILDHLKAQPATKKVLIVLDGMNYWQWQLINQNLEGNSIKINAGATLAFIPTITAWSRQAIFKGEKPDLNRNNSNESALFTVYWKGKGYLPHQVKYTGFGIHNPFDIHSVSSDTYILGLVCNDLDDLIHGPFISEVHWKESTLQWLKESKLNKTISDLINAGFHVYITADHGSIVASGLKNLTLSEKVGTLSRSKRHINFSNETLRNHFISKNPQLDLEVRGLSVFLKNNDAFVPAGNKLATHGGSHLWEVVVPFVNIYEKQ